MKLRGLKKRINLQSFTKLATPIKEKLQNVQLPSFLYINKVAIQLIIATIILPDKIASVKEFYDKKVKTLPARAEIVKDSAVATVKSMYSNARFSYSVGSEYAKGKLFNKNIKLYNKPKFEPRMKSVGSDGDFANSIYVFDVTELLKNPTFNATV